jgi:hypothetical protein
MQKRLEITSWSRKRIELDDGTQAFHCAGSATTASPVDDGIRMIVPRILLALVNRQ